MSQSPADLARLHRLSMRLGSATDLRSLLEEVLDATMALQGGDSGDVQLYDEESDTLSVAAHRGVRPGNLDQVTVSASDSACGRALVMKERVIVEDVTTDRGYSPHCAVAAAAGHRGVHCTPLIARVSRKPLGILSIFFRSPYRPSDSELLLTDLYARQAADMIDWRPAEQRLRDSEEQFPRPLEVSGAVAFLQDVDKETRSEARLRQSEGRLRAAVSLAKLGLYAWNPATNELSWDEAVKAMWGLPGETPIDWSIWREGVHLDDLARVDEALARCLDPEGDGVYDIEYRVIGRADRAQRWIATHGRVEFENGRAASFLGVALDITDRKRTEERLEQLVETRTRQLEGVNTSLATEIVERQQVSRRLERLQMELFHASRLSVAGQMAATIAHELSQPLAAMVNSLNAIRRLLASNPSGAEISLRELTEDAGAQAERANQIIRRLRNFIRGGSPQRRPEPIKPLVEEAVAFAMTGPEGLGVTASCYFDPLVPEAVVDRIQIQQVIANLVRNSLQAMKGSSRPKLTVTTQGRLGMLLEIAITDGGEGVKEGFEQDLFEPFMTTRQDGMGLGLSICRSIVEAHGGDIRYRPAHGGGATFSFTILAAGQAAA